MYYFAVTRTQLSADKNDRSNRVYKLFIELFRADGDLRSLRVPTLMSVRNIGLSVSTTGTVIPKKRDGRRKLDIRNEVEFMLESSSSVRATFVGLAPEISLSNQAVWRAARELELFAYKQPMAQKLTCSHIEEHLEAAQRFHRALLIEKTAHLN